MDGDGASIGDAPFLAIAGEYTLLIGFGDAIGEGTMDVDGAGCVRKPGEYSGEKAEAACNARETKPGLGVGNGRALGYPYGEA